MKFGIQVNVGPPGTPDWKFLHMCDMSKGEWDSYDEAYAQMKLWHPNYAKANIFRVSEVDDSP